MRNSSIIMYTTEDGLTKIETTFDEDTVWLSLDQMAELFQRDKSTISRHIKNIFEEGEAVYREYPKVCVNLQTGVRYNYSVWRFLLWQEEKVTHHRKQQCAK